MAQPLPTNPQSSEPGSAEAGAGEMGDGSYTPIDSEEAPIVVHFSLSTPVIQHFRLP